MPGLEAVFTSDKHMATIRPDQGRFPDLHACAFLPSPETVMTG